MPLIIRFIITAFAAIIAAYLLPGVHLQGFLHALVLAVILGLLNTFLKPLLILLTIPITLFTLGLFLIVINALIILLAGRISPGFEVDSFWWALLFSIVLSFVRGILERLGDTIDRNS